MRIALYARVSSEAQAERGTVGSQLEALRAAAAEAGHDIAAEYVDDGHSGARLDRPGLDDLRDAAEAGAFEVLWCLTPDRLARAYALQVLILDELARLGVTVRFLDAPAIDDDPQARLLVQMQGVIAEYERAKTAERHRRGKLYRARAGEAIFWKVPYGYRRVPCTDSRPAYLVVHEPEAAVVRRIFDDYTAGGLSMRAICRRLYEDGIPSPTGKPVWQGSTVSGLLRNPAYAGTARWYRHETLPPDQPGGKPRRRRRPDDEHVQVAVPAIVSAETFEAAQKVKHTNRAFSPRRAAPDAWLLRRLVVCAPCDIKAGCLQAPTSRGGHNRYYVCAYKDPVRAGGPLEAARIEAVRRGAVATIGRVSVHPNGTNAVPGEVTAWLDARAPDAPTLDGMVSAIRERFDRAATRLGVDADVVEESSAPGVVFDDGLRACIDATLRAGGFQVPPLVTAAGHDAGALAPRLPTGMLYVRNREGISHSPAEYADESDCADGVRALSAVMRELVT